eukprot:s3182_g10.t1
MLGSTACAPLPTCGQCAALPTRTTLACTVRAKAAKQKCLVACHAGSSRSVSVVLAYLVMEEGMSLHDAWDLVRRLRSGAQPNRNFARQLIDLDRAVHGVTCVTLADLGFDEEEPKFLGSGFVSGPGSPCPEMPRSPSRSRSPQRREERKASPRRDDGDGGDVAWIEIGDLPPKSNWSCMRRLVTQAGGHILGGKVYPQRKPPCALARVGSQKEADSVAEKLDGSELSGRRITCRTIGDEEREKIERS